MKQSNDKKTASWRQRPKERKVWSAAAAVEFQRLLLHWYSRRSRCLPWRSDPTAYKVWISEIMLQQTQVKTVLPYFQKFLERFPDLDTLAGAHEREVLRLWAGLGYYSRARNLHRAALQIMQRYGGRFPSSREDVEALPGIGRYTAGAIRSIAFNCPDPVVDGNVRRVITRLHAIESREAESFYWNQASSWIPAGRAAEFNQAVMELGALVCLPAKPLCPECPASSLCGARSRGIQERIPAAKSARGIKDVILHLLVLEHRDSILLSSKNGAGFIPGDWGLPLQIAAGKKGKTAATDTWPHIRLPAALRPKKCGAVKHSITNHRIEALVYWARIPADQPYRAPVGMKWAARPNAEEFLTSSLFRKALKAAAEERMPEVSE
jgi:A/G-specific adenine glycosylase